VQLACCGQQAGERRRIGIQSTPLGTMGQPARFLLFSVYDLMMFTMYVKYMKRSAGGQGTHNGNAHNSFPQIEDGERLYENQ
jgi:hypothetical protein